MGGFVVNSHQPSILLWLQKSIARPGSEQEDRLREFLQIFGLTLGEYTLLRPYGLVNPATPVATMRLLLEAFWDGEVLEETTKILHDPGLPPLVRSRDVTWEIDLFLMDHSSLPESNEASVIHGIWTEAFVLKVAVSPYISPSALQAFMTREYYGFWRRLAMDGRENMTTTLSGLVLAALGEYQLRLALGPSFGSDDFVRWNAAEVDYWWAAVQSPIRKSRHEADAWKESMAGALPAGILESIAYQMVTRFRRSHPAMTTDELFSCSAEEYAAVMPGG